MIITLLTFSVPEIYLIKLSREMVWSACVVMVLESIRSSTSAVEPENLFTLDAGDEPFAVVVSMWRGCKLYYYYYLHSSIDMFIKR